MNTFRVTVLVPMTVNVWAEKLEDVDYDAIATAVDRIIDLDLRDHLDFSAITPDNVLWAGIEDLNDNVQP